MSELDNYPAAKFRWRTGMSGRILVPASAKDIVSADVRKTFPFEWLVVPRQVSEAEGVTEDEVAIEATDAVKCVERWTSLACAVSAEKAIMPSWVMAMIYAESRGNEKAEAPDGGWGLMQITSPAYKKGYTKAQVFDPATNLRIGARIISSHFPVTVELPVIASCYNAGAPAFGRAHPSEKSPWGMRETRGHITRVCAAHNAIVRMFEKMGVSDERAS